ncbi:protein phosphatase 2C domain-containing protein [Capnocytophaga canis]|uniref:protein phosphatase 2C domain-containing protein n=1 Tax=Capnocytophaga canis TaxID=1848903 RepID=UPI00156235DF|nr:protein phosphatase 2C domain-containing protein [Capnocytophaga canis]
MKKITILTLFSLLSFYGFAIETTVVSTNEGTASSISSSTGGTQSPTEVNLSQQILLGTLEEKISTSKDEILDTLEEKISTSKDEILDTLEEKISTSKDEILDILKIILIIISAILGIGLLGSITFIFKQKKQIKMNKSKVQADHKHIVETINKLNISFNEDFDELIQKFNAILKVLDQNQSIHYGDNFTAKNLDEFSEKMKFKLREIVRQTANLEGLYESNKQKYDSLFSKNDADEAKKKLREIVLKNAELTRQLEEVNASPVLTAESLNGTFINADILVTAGPRKDKESDSELGEDASGVYNTPTGTYFWIFDGTSDSPNLIWEKKHIFSSRVLAQKMSHTIASILKISKYSECLNMSDELLKEVFDRAVSQVKVEFTQNINDAPSEVRQSIFENEQKNVRLYCSTTVCFGFLSKNGKLNYFYLGDSTVNAFELKNGEIVSTSKDKNEKPSRLFLMLKKEEKGWSLQASNYQERISFFSKEKINYLVAYSDGVSASENFIVENPKLEIANVSNREQKSFDDKSLIVLERKIFR